VARAAVARQLARTFRKGLLEGWGVWGAVTFISFDDVWNYSHNVVFVSIQKGSSEV
jgi:hypothetical protein